MPADGVRVSGLVEARAAFQRAPEVAARELRDGGNELVRGLATDAQRAARGHSRQAGLLARTVDVTRGFTPTVTAGGNTRVGSNRVPAFKVLYGSEFGARRLRQFRPARPSGYWFFPTIQQSPRIDATVDDVADAVARDLTRGGA